MKIVYTLGKLPLTKSGLLQESLKGFGWKIVENLKNVIDEADLQYIITDVLLENYSKWPKGLVIDVEVFWKLAKDNRIVRHVCPGVNVLTEKYDLALQCNGHENIPYSVGIEVYNGKLCYKGEIDEHVGWTLKQSGSHRGSNVIMFEKARDAIDYLEEITESMDTRKRYVLQHLVSPALLFHGKKFDIRLYIALVFTPDILELYLYPTGVVRVAGFAMYNPTASLSARHITNYGWQKSLNQDPQLFLWSSEDEAFGDLYQRVCPKISTMLSSIVSQVHSFLNKFQTRGATLLGVDILLDTDEKPWLIECNLKPTLWDKISPGPIHNLGIQITRDYASILDYSTGGVTPLHPWRQVSIKPPSNTSSCTLFD